MERFVGVEEARSKLGQLVDDVGRGGEPVVFTKRGRALAVLLSREEYTRVKEASTRLARGELQDRLAKIRRRVLRAGLEPDVVDEAVAAVRGLE